MKVLVDGGNSGSGGYLHYLSGNLGSGALEGFEVLMVCSPNLAKKLGPLDPQVNVRVEPDLDAPRRWTRLAWWRRSWPRLVASFEPDLIVHPTGLLRGSSGNIPRVAVHHFMAPFSPVAYRAYGPSRLTATLFYWRTRLLRSLRRADGVVFLADYTRDAVHPLIGTRPQVTVVPNAVPRAFSAAGEPVREELSSPVRILCVSTLYLFKYQWNVVEAVARLRNELDLDIHLDMVGGGEPRARAKLMRSIEENCASEWVTVREVPAAEMPAVYRAADLFVFPSADEAWPVTLGEAMGSGLPIACSNRMAMPDILRDAGTYFDPESPDEMVAALCPLLTDSVLRMRCAALAAGYASEYTWDRSARLLATFMHRLVRR